MARGGPSRRSSCMVSSMVCRAPELCMTRFMVSIGLVLLYSSNLARRVKARASSGSRSYWIGEDRFFCPFHSLTRHAFAKMTEPASKLARARSPHRVMSTLAPPSAPDASQRPMSRFVISFWLVFAVKVTASCTAKTTAATSMKAPTSVCSTSQSGFTLYSMRGSSWSSSTASMLACSSNERTCSPRSNLGLAIFTWPREKQ
mmetsp:Transcript_43588/g.123347  ORF Transcript_43588/g.123347 Transcript_43588/m.123347 type:complete len:202 (+) Transcript_43588:678-1283(+)